MKRLTLLFPSAIESYSAALALTNISAAQDWAAAKKALDESAATNPTGAEKPKQSSYT